MSLIAAGKFRFRALRRVLAFGLACCVAFTARAGIRGPGKYCGVVVFDRWDTCFLLSGKFITYISDSVKDKLRPFKGTALQVDAFEVFQPINPGDALIRKYEIVGRAPDTHHWVMLDGLELVVKPDFKTHESPAFVIEVRNAGHNEANIDSSEIGPVLLGPTPQAAWSWPSDGKSGVWITRATVLHPASWQAQVGENGSSASYAIDPQSQPPERFALGAGESRNIRLVFQVSPGQYQFMVGYGGGVHEEKSIASNSISFTVDEEGSATLATAAGRP